MLRASLGVATAALAVILAAPAHADGYGNTACGYNPTVARADAAVQNASIAVDNDQRRYLYQAENGYSGQQAAYAAWRRDLAFYNQAKDYDDHLRANACH